MLHPQDQDLGSRGKRGGQKDSAYGRLGPGSRVLDNREVEWTSREIG